MRGMQNAGIPQGVNRVLGQGGAPQMTPRDLAMRGFRQTGIPQGVDRIAGAPQQPMTARGVAQQGLDRTGIPANVQRMAMGVPQGMAGGMMGYGGGPPSGGANSMGIPVGGGPGMPPGGSAGAPMMAPQGGAPPQGAAPGGIGAPGGGPPPMGPPGQSPGFSPPAYGAGGRPSTNLGPYLGYTPGQQMMPRGGSAPQFQAPGYQFQGAPMPAWKGPGMGTMLEQQGPAAKSAEVQRAGMLAGQADNREQLFATGMQRRDGGPMISRPDVLNARAGQIGQRGNAEQIAYNEQVAASEQAARIERARQMGRLF